MVVLELVVGVVVEEEVGVVVVVELVVRMVVEEEVGW